MRRRLTLLPGMVLAVLAVALAAAPVDRLRTQLPPTPAMPRARGVARQDPIEELRAYVERFTGPKPNECGLNKLPRPQTKADEEVLKQSVRCGLEARDHRKPFWTFTLAGGTDSWLGEGLLGTPEGTLFKFTYDSAPCGGPHCWGTFAIGRCDEPFVADRARLFSQIACRKSQ